MCEMERVSETSTVLAKTLDEQRTKLKIAEEELVMYWPPTLKSISTHFYFLKLMMKICNFFLPTCLYITLLSSFGEGGGVRDSYLFGI